jgi:DNA-binding response OmpR family regulator
MKILLLEDDAILGDLIYNSLIDNNYETTLVEDGDEALDLVVDEKFDLFIFDVNVPGISGLELLKSIRGYNITTPVIMITAYQDTTHLKQGFDYGCDDYIKKPFDLEELHQRIKNLAKRFSIEDSNTIIIDENTKLFTDKNLIVQNNKEYEISNKENKILTYFHTHKSRTISFDELVQNIWHFDETPSETTIRVYIKNLRTIIGKERIKTIRGFGYSYE